MLKRLQPLALKMLGDLKEAHQYIRKDFSLFTLCKQYTEKYIEMDKRLIPALSSYLKELLLFAENKENSLENKTAELEKAILRPIKEAVFFPYLSSMWDSMESVYFSFKNDENFECFVVLIPYYDLVNGKVARMIYDIDKFPKNIQITNYKNYNLAEFKPDIAFISNPYDENNAVSRVEKTFYSENIKNYCRKLVYIPYFVTNGESIPNHLILSPAVINSNYTVVENDKIKKNFLTAIKEQCGIEKGAFDSRYWNEKIVALGSPKIDAVLTKTINDFEIPQDWKNKLFKTDGSKKKVVFINTSIGTMLERTINRKEDKYSDLYLTKLQKVFDFFKDKDDYCLLWRPHPLMLQSFQGMRLPLLPLYLKIVDDYKKENYGIYDDSSELQRAIVLSDIYYGDQSSVIWLYQLTGKPVVTNSSAEYLPKLNKLLPIKCVKIKGSIYFTTLGLSYLYKYSDGLTEVVCKFPENDARFLWNDVLFYENKLYFPPFVAQKIYIYNLETNETESIELRKDLIAHSFNYVNLNFTKSYLYKENIYFVGYYYPAILKINPKTLETEYYYDGFIKWNSNKTIRNFVSNSLRVDKKIYSVCIDNNIIMCFDLEKNKYSFIETKNKKGFYGIGYYKNSLYLQDYYADEKLHLLKIDLANKQQKDIYADSINFKTIHSIMNNTNYKMDMYFFDGVILLFLLFTDAVFKINSETFESERIRTLEYDYRKTERIDNLIYAYPTKGNFVDIYEPNGNFKTVTFEIDEFPSLQFNNINNMYTISENASFGLETYFSENFVYTNTDTEKLEYKNSGQAIYEFLKKVIK
jgi:hypothetical protein